MTVHVPLVHPLYAAKALATVDHISHGRAGLNIVCGWNPKEFGMFGTPLVEKGYDQAARVDRDCRETLCLRRADRFRRRILSPQGCGQPSRELAGPAPGDDERGLGGPGRDFAAAHCDYLFTTFSEIAEAGKHVADIAERAEKIGRKVGCYTVAHVVCRETVEEADAYYTRYAVTMADHAAVDQHMAGKKEFSQSHDAHAF